MTKRYIATPQRTKEIINHYSFTFKKSLGQNFLVDVNILENIISHAGIDKKSGVIEVGPGIGSLTEQLALHADHVVSYEIDQRLLPILQETVGPYDNIDVIHQDILKVDLKRDLEMYFANQDSVHLVANLPYYITTPILLHVLHQNTSLKTMTVMLQKEVAERMAAKPNTKAYGSLSIAVQYYSEVEVVMNVPKTAFIPQPNVVSSVLHMKLRQEPPVNVVDERFFFDLVQASFAYRRKTLRNNLTAYFKHKYTKDDVEHFLQLAQIDGNRRGETLTIQEFSHLVNTILKNGF